MRQSVIFKKVVITKDPKVHAGQGEEGVASERVHGRDGSVRSGELKGADAAVRGRKSRFRTEMLWVMWKPRALGGSGEGRALGSDGKEEKTSADTITES